jgi:hypothetical protein
MYSKKNTDRIKRILSNKETYDDSFRGMKLRHFKTDDKEKRKEINKDLEYIWTYDLKGQSKKLKELKEKHNGEFTRVFATQKNYRQEYSKIFAKWGVNGYDVVEVGSKKKKSWDVWELRESWWRPENETTLIELQDALNSCKQYRNFEDRTIKMWTYPTLYPMSNCSRELDVIITKNEIIYKKKEEEIKE